jgi:ribosome-associated heat shock protein Hsp15
MTAENPSHPRIDKYLWSVRIFKTRSMATDACKKGRVKIDGQTVKPSRILKTGEEIEIRKPPVSYTYKVTGFPKSRVSAKLVPDFTKNLTPPEELEKLKMQDDFFIRRDKGTGRPTKKERRIIDKLKKD